jgi:hypothetical protein
VWPAVPGGGPGGDKAPHDFKISFKEGGIGTLYPLFYTLLDKARRTASQAQAAAQAAPEAQHFVGNLVNKAFVDPNDPTRVYLAQPVDDSQRLNYQPTYAANYGHEERYEPMNLRP